MRLDIVIPAHNEEQRIGHTLDRYRRAGEDADGDVRLLVALDDCTDATADVVAAHATADPHVRAYRYPRLGKGGVILETFRRCEADLVGFVDADCATPPQELFRLAQTVEEHDCEVAIASRWHPTSLVPGHRAWRRRAASAGFALAVRRVMRLPYRDTQCGAKVVRADALRRLVPLVASRDFLFDVDLLTVARSLGFRVAEVPTVWVDQGGSHVSAGSDGRRMAASLARLWVHHRTLPVRLPSAVTESAEVAPARSRQLSVLPSRLQQRTRVGRRAA